MKLENPISRWREWRHHRTLSRQVARVESFLQAGEGTSPGADDPVLVFNASTRIQRLSLNGAFSLLASWAIRAESVPVRYLVCRQGMLQCVLGTHRLALAQPPPCQPCLRMSDVLFPGRQVIGLPIRPDVVTRTRRELADLPWRELIAWTYRGIPLGELCLPSLRWALRRHRLDDQDPVRSLYRLYLASAASMADELGDRLTETHPRALIVFNGVFFPEAVARHVARSRGIPVFSHEVGLRPFSAFFTDREATFREIEIPADRTLRPEQEQHLDRYLADRFRGRFTMAGVRFWDGIQPLPVWLKERARGFQDMVVVFGNVVFDTSQLHANTLFEDMFAWLDAVSAEMRAHPEILFVLRAHPDEGRAGKESQETFAQWVLDRGLDGQKNVVFLPPEDPTSSYDLIRASRFVLVYNSSIGLEASILGAAVLCAGRARYTQVPTVFYPSDRSAYDLTLREWLNQKRIEVAKSFRRNARAYLHTELFLASLDLSEFLQADPSFPGMVSFKGFEPSRLRESPELRVVTHGVLKGTPFLMREA